MTSRASAVVFLTIMTASGLSMASDRTINDPVAIGKILAEIQTVGGDMASRLASGGMSASSVRIHTITKEDVSDDPMNVKLGDVEYKVYTVGEPRAPRCPIAGSPTLIKRGKNWRPQDRTGVWLLTDKCALP